MTHKNKIAVISTMNESPWGGSEELWSQMLSAALDEGHKVMALIPQWNPRFFKVQALVDSGLKLAEWTDCNTSVDQNRSAGRPWWYPYNTVEEFAPDIVCISHGGMMDIVNGHLLLIQMLLECKLDYAIVIQANTDLYYPDDSKRKILQHYFQNAKRIFFVSRQNLEIARRQLAMPLDHAEVINNPLNLDCHDYVHWPESHTAQFASVARFDTWAKGHDILLEVLSQKKWASRDWKLRLFGKGIHENYIRELIDYFNLSAFVEIPGHNWNVRQIWEQHQLMILSSRLEGTPLVLFEAMLCGRPSVVTDVGGNADWIQDGVNGFVARAATPALLDEALESAWQNRTNWHSMGLSARETVLSRHEILSGKTLLEKLSLLCPASTFSSKSSPPLISIIIPCYNYRHYLTAAVVSVANQTFQDFELIIVDDGSTDDSIAVAERLISMLPHINIRLIPIKNSGTGNPAFPRNRGVMESRGKYILFLDADDMIMPTMLAECLQLLEGNPEISIAYTDHIYFDDNANWPVVTPDYDFRTLLVSNHLAYCALFRRKAWDDAGGVPTDMGYEDWDFWITCGTRGHFARRIPKPLFCYRQHESGRFKNELIIRDTLLKAQIVRKHKEYFDRESVDAACRILLSTDGKWLPNLI